MRGRGLGGIYERGGQWWIRYSLRGRQYREPAGAKKAAAVSLLKKRLGEIGQGRLLGREAERLTFAELAKMLENDYKANGRKSLDRALRSIAHLRDTFGLSLAIDITADRVSSYIQERQEKEAKAATIRNEL